MGMAKVLKCVASDNQDNTVLAINIAVKGILCAIYTKKTEHFSINACKGFKKVTHSVPVTIAA